MCESESIFFFGVWMAKILVDFDGFSEIGGGERIVSEPDLAVLNCFSLI